MKATSTTGRAKGPKPRAENRAVAKSVPVLARCPLRSTSQLTLLTLSTISTRWPTSSRGQRKTLARRSRPRFWRRSLILKTSDKRAFESLRAQLKRAGCRVAALDEALSKEIGAGPGGKAQTQADTLLRLKLAGRRVLHAADMTAYADLDINGHRETWPVKSKGFSRWLARAFYQETRGAAGSDAHTGGAQCHRSQGSPRRGRARGACPRSLALDGKLYIDLCDKAWRAIEIDADGWRVVDAPPVRFQPRVGGA